MIITTHLIHHSRIPNEEFDVTKLFTPIKNQPEYDEVMAGRAVSPRVKDRLNKPDFGTGLWASFPTIDGKSSWAVSGIDDITEECYEIILDPKARLLIIDNDEAMYKISNEYKFNFEKLSEDYDVIMLTKSRYFKFSHIFTKDHGMTDLEFPEMFYGWDCKSALFLNPTFTVGEKLKIRTS